MKIKYKLILVFAVIILAASLPLSLFILNRQEKSKISLLTHQGEINSAILSRSILNILLMNGGHIPSSRVDAREMISILAPLTEDGLIYADAVMLSSRPDLNGLVLANFVSPDFESVIATREKVEAGEMGRLKSTGAFNEITVPGVAGICYEFVTSASLPGERPVCLGRLIFAKSVVLEPIEVLRRVIYGATGLAIVIVSIIGFAFSRYFSRPIDKLIKGVEKIGSGDLNYRVEINSRDELGRLGNTFNHLAEVVRLEIAELVAANEELKRLDQLKDEFLANISHELRSPLYGMIGIAESLVNGAAGELGGEVVHDLALIQKSGNRLSHLVNDILDFSKLKHRDIDLDLSPVNLYSVAQLCISIMAPLAEHKSLALVNRIHPDSSYVYADENRLQQVFLNLMGNAIKFTDTGEVVLSSEGHPDDGDMVVVSVTDTGIGVPPDKSDQIFEIFEQGDGSTSRSYGGTGLGLAITKKLVSLHGGEIWVEKVDAPGSRFSFTLKRSREQAAEDSAGTGGTPEPVVITENDIRVIDNETPGDEAEAGKVLVVDDEPVNLQVLINNLVLEGYTVVAARSGAEAMEILERGEFPELIILDVMLPRMSGYEVCQAIREKYPEHDLPILMLTAKNKPGDVVTGLEAGANDYLSKPVNRQELLARVRSLISLKNSVRFHNELTVIKRDIQIAHEIMQSILFKDLPEIEGVTMAVRYLPMKKMGGDFYDIQLLENRKLSALIADVSGHGIPAAFICSMLRVVYSFFIDRAREPADIMSLINSSMYNFIGGQFITACFAFIDLDEMKLHQSSAGHWPLVILRRETGEIVQNRVNYMPIGWEPLEDYRTSVLDLEKGDRIILFTDGIIEARDREGRMFTEKRLHSLIRDTGDLDTGELADRILYTVKGWTGIDREESHDDDVTLIVIDI